MTYEEFTQLTREEAELYNMENKEECAELALAELVWKNKGDVLDIGCGNGKYTQLFSREEYLGIDISKPLICVARDKYPLYKFAVVDARELPFRDNSFDNVIIKSVLEHVPNEEDCIKIFKEALRVTKKWLIVAWHTHPRPMKESKIIELKGHFGKTIHQNIYNLHIFEPIFDTCKNIDIIKVDNFMLWVIQK